MSTNFNEQLLSEQRAQEYSVFPSPTKSSPVSKSYRQVRRDTNGHEIKDFFTDYGIQRVSIDGDLSSNRPVIFTYHDIGINHNGCFLSFFNLLKAHDPKFQFFNIVHIDAPRHHAVDDEQDGRTVDSSMTVTGNEHPSLNQSDSFDLVELANQIEEIRSQLHIERFIAMGIGAGCSVWTHYAMRFSPRLRGMILINGVSGEGSWREWTFEGLLRLMGNRSQYLWDSFHSSLLGRYFPRPVSTETYDFFLDQFSSMDTTAAIRYFRGFAKREALTVHDLAKIKTKTLVLCGEVSRARDETILMQRMMPRGNTQFVLVQEAGFLMTESSPQKLCSDVNLFMESLGLTSISLQKKYGNLPSPQQQNITL